MVKPLRIEYPDAWYHVMNRGRRGEQVFLKERDCKRFLELLKELVELWNLRIAAYCQMPNHYHLLVQTPDANLSRCMRHIHGVYTQRFKRLVTFKSVCMVLLGQFVDTSQNIFELTGGRLNR